MLKLITGKDWAYRNIPMSDAKVEEIRQEHISLYFDALAARDRLAMRAHRRAAVMWEAVQNCRAGYGTPFDIAKAEREADKAWEAYRKGSRK